MSRMVGAVALVGVAALAVAGAWLVVDRGGEAVVERREVPLLMLWNLPYGFDQDGECAGGPDSIGWVRPQERSFPPDYGFYCTADPGYIAHAIGQMEDAGVGVVLLTWFGWGDINFDGEIHRADNSVIAPDFVGANTAVKRILEHLRDSNSKVKAALMVEPFFLNADPKILPADLTISQRQQILDYAKTNFYEPFNGQMFRWGDEEKPLIANWKNNEGRWLLSETGDTYFTFREYGVVAEGADWEFTAHRGLEGMEPGTDGAMWIAPRFDEFYLWNQGALPPGRNYGTLVRLDPYLREGLYDQGWRKVYENSGEVSMVMLYGWNPWAEAAAIEPSLPDGDLLLRKTAWYYHRFTEGLEFQPFCLDTTRLWSQPADLKQFIGNLDARELGLDEGVSVSEFLAARLDEAQNLIERRLGRAYSPSEVPPGVRNIHLRLSANIYNYILMNKRNPVMQVGEFNFQLNDDRLFTDALKEDLALYRERKPVQVIYP